MCNRCRHRNIIAELFRGAIDASAICVEKTEANPDATVSAGDKTYSKEEVLLTFQALGLVGRVMSGLADNDTTGEQVLAIMEAATPEERSEALDHLAVLKETIALAGKGLIAAKFKMNDSDPDFQEFKAIEATRAANVPKGAQAAIDQLKRVLEAQGHEVEVEVVQNGKVVSPGGVTKAPMNPLGFPSQNSELN